MTPDPYTTLGVSKGASQEEIKSAYRKLARQLHPDLNPGNKEAEKRFKDVSAAYELVGTPEQRAKYEQGKLDEERLRQQQAHGQRPFYYETQGGAGGRYTHSFEGFDEDLFANIFGGRGGFRAGPSGAQSAGGMDIPGEDRLFRMNVAFRDSVAGAEREITLPGGKRLRVKIPPGILTGSKLRFAGQGAPGIGKGPPGDLYIEVEVAQDRSFRREGRNIILEVPVSLGEAVLGAEIRVPTIDGSVQLRIPPGVTTGTRLRLRGKGVRGSDPGDQFVVLKIAMPKKIDPELERAIRDWNDKHAYDPREEEHEHKASA